MQCTVYADVTCPFLFHLLKIVVWGMNTKMIDILATMIAMSNKLSFIFDPGDFCLLPAFIKQYQDN